MPIQKHRPLRTLAALALASVVFTACITGERPTLVEPVSEVVDDPAIAAVVERLDRADETAFTATYDIIPSSSGTTTAATVINEGTSRRRVRIGDVDYITDGGVTRTCQNDDAGCVDFLDDARISDLNITNKFWGVAFASRLRLDGSRRVGFGEGSSETIAGQPALCVDVPVVSAAVTYCALEAGPLARYFGADVSIELTSFAVGADPADLEF